MGELFNPVTILLHIANAALLFVAVYFLLYKPVRKFMAQREAKVAATIDEAKENLEKAKKAAEGSEEIIAAGQARADEELANAQKRAREEEKKILDAARAMADGIVEDARRQAEAILKNARRDMKEQATNLALDIARSILEREVTPADQEKVIDDLTRKVE